MKKLNKIGIPLTALAISVGIMSVANAQTPTPFSPEKLQIEIASTETVITKNEVIKKFRELFPNKFDFLTTNDFHLNTGRYYPEDETVRYNLNFSKYYQGKELYGSVTFAGDELKLESFHFEPVNQSDALFPAKVSKEEAQTLAQNFVKKFAEGETYQLEKNSAYNYYYSNQLLTEPVRYHFSFLRTENNIEIANQRMEVTVLGNGEIVQYYSYPENTGKFTFDEANNLKNEQEVLAKIKEKLNLQLQYQVNYDYRSNKRTVQLVYMPLNQFVGIHALSGQWFTVNGSAVALPKDPKVEKIVGQPLKPRQGPITVEEAKRLSLDLLKLDSDKVKLRVESVEEITNPDGREMIYISYMYEFNNGGSGSSLVIDKATGEIIQYHNMKNELLRELGEKQNSGKKITSSEALAKAVEHLKEWMPSSLHNYSKPLAEPFSDDNYGAYSFTFPRIVNGIPVNGDDINVSVGFDGSLMSLYVNSSEIKEWPTTEGIISKQQAEKLFSDAINLKLQYVQDNRSKDSKHYSLVYTPFYHDSSSLLDAAKGEWTSMFGGKEYPIVSHDTAEEELNYLIQNNILEVKNSDFNADAAVKKGEALEILLKSISYFYEGNLPQQGESHQTFENIGPDHEYYQVVERAAGMGILDTKNTVFNTDAALTREELAVWYIRALGLEQAAKHADIYKLDAKDAKDITYKGYAALVDALEILPAKDGLFNPKKSVTYADLAESTIRLAHKVYEKGNPYRYYY
ncbi:hypothetical protein D1B33_16820 [Lysinibacillus yapensis]|uniref:SLH domain-containing protein n=1 Tax=Ureibacillus yapensis TaxID=2304605 RepID=A0A396S385_9BACL|nr:YcdB/YcdC domain-containing protein [Lysinibacillus yapensis]RHW32398.1 hypothetical protein D1B33_16820 [Lysinibacillus yapensis]